MSLKTKYSDKQKDISINKLKQKLEISLKQNSFSFKLYSKRLKGLTVS